MKQVTNSQLKEAKIVSCHRCFELQLPFFLHTLIHVCDKLDTQCSHNDNFHKQVPITCVHVCILWLNFILSSIFISFVFYTYYHTLPYTKVKEIKIELRIKLNHNMYCN